ncbi:Diaminopimelate decarboxylase [Geobacter metallireducens RCH3]|uniref:Diaminopimelate decarboxylase n=1 Tax=Geobacter metallireducens (strain ATCC 53774 / DSM 7210 / GS-15) TaxID=269799 RepID=Q39Z59_GEOMG|nr:diaminopimelate decarboxylase [Geobacter metallireducens]ABB30465.1 diaminopimelate decarboxylase [Geobacter metallireducens GS-15]EHP87342.1 Diaminopimelate decarboxylase [Geobacter metallireducens RCH3]
MTMTSFGPTGLDATLIPKIAGEWGTPIYLHDQQYIENSCDQLLAMPNAYGLHVRYAIKANSDRTVLRIVTGKGLDLDCSSLDEAARAHAAGIPYSRMMLTTQEVPTGEERTELEAMIKVGLKYNVCSTLQYQLIADFAAQNKIDLSMRVHPGAAGGGESATRDTGSEYSCFGVHLRDVPTVKALADEKGLRFTQVHVHIGSGGAPEKWQENIDRELGFIKTYFPDAVTVSFGGGLKVARMPGEKQADIATLGAYAKQRIEEFKAATGRELMMEIEPGTFVVANSGHIVTRIIDKKFTNEMNFLIVDGGMELLTRPLLYGSEHPIAIVRQDGTLLSSEYDQTPTAGLKPFGIVGRCCESGDSVRLDKEGNIVPVMIVEPEIGDYVVIGGTGAYSESMSPENYNSHRKPGAVMRTKTGELVLIRKKQVREQLTQNELDVTL